ncbi:MAG TPA: MBL fold metallo-hydrolase [Gemmatimonadaceae bacterium]|nr:MBL fold metallo-hydrolase [Gemmatimonadaceae bacterium]
MILRRFHDVQLAQMSYLIGCSATRSAIVVDPIRDADMYIAAATASGLTITHVTETHIHADFISGARELVARTGAQLLLSAEGPKEWQYEFAETDGAKLLHDGDMFDVGRIRFTVRHTPGHTPEHLSFLVKDVQTAEEPVAILTGDFVFVSDVGRPDLLERAANVPGTKEASARQLFLSLSRIRKLPDYLQIWPGHGAGSACGKALGDMPSSTVGYERMANWALSERNVEAFVDRVLEGQPDPPAYFGVMKRINRDGPPVLGARAEPSSPPPGSLADLGLAGALVVDVREPDRFARAHVPGTLNIPWGNSFTTLAGSLLPYDHDLYLLADDRANALAAARALTMIGLDRVAGIFDEEACIAWLDGGRALGRIRQFTPQVLLEQVETKAVMLIDVRSKTEWNSGHHREAHHIPLGDLPRALASLPRDRPIAVYCQRGSRSAVASSLLSAAGIEAVNVPAGWMGIEAAQRGE